MLIKVIYLKPEEAKSQIRVDDDNVDYYPILYLI